MTIEAEFGGGRRDLALTVRLDDTAGHQRISFSRDRLLQHVVEFAQFVAAKSDAR